MQNEMIILTKAYGLIGWLLPKTEKFPRHYRSSVTQRMIDAALRYVEQLYQAQAFHGRLRRQALTEADAVLNQLRFYLRLALDWQWLSLGQYEHVSRLVEENGRLLGGWLKAPDPDEAGGEGERRRRRSEG